jgi:hypothetical protein
VPHQRNIWPFAAGGNSAYRVRTLVEIKGEFSVPRSLMPDPNRTVRIVWTVLWSLSELNFPLQVAGGACPDQRTEDLAAVTGGTDALVAIGDRDLPKPYDLARLGYSASIDVSGSYKAHASSA